LGKLSDDQIKQLVHQHIKNTMEWWGKNFYEEFDDEAYALLLPRPVDFTII
jgi:hypothetical protein